MTEKLKMLMHERAGVPAFDPPDVEGLVRAGTVRARRRRLAVAAGAVSVAAVVGGLAVAVTQGDDRGAEATAADTPPTRSVTWATGSTVHTPDGAYELDHPIAAYVRTSVGYVFTDGAGSVYSAVDDRVTRVGDVSATSPHLVADGDGPLVAWVDPSEEAPRFVVHDQSTGTTTVLDGDTEPGMGELADEENPAYVYGVDGRTVVWRDVRGAVAVDLDTGEQRVLDADARNGFDIVAVEDGVFAFNAGDAGTAVGTTRDEAVVLENVYGSVAAFSPQASWVSVDADQPEVYDVGTGEKVTLDIDGRWFATGFEWLDDHTLAVIAARDEGGHYELLTCSVPAGACEVAAPHLGAVGNERFVLPVGEPRG